MSSLFGTSWRTSIGSYILAALVVLEQASTDPFPTTWQGWLHYVAGFLIAVIGRVAKDGSVSNALRPADAQTIPVGVKT